MCQVMQLDHEDIATWDGFAPQARQLLEERQSRRKMQLEQAARWLWAKGGFWDG